MTLLLIACGDPSTGDPSTDDSANSTVCPLPEGAVELEWAEFDSPCGGSTDVGTLSSEEEFVGAYGCASDIDWETWRLVGFAEVIDIPNARVTSVYSSEGATTVMTEVHTWCGGYDPEGAMLEQTVLVPVSEEPVALRVCEYGGCDWDSQPPP